MRCNWIIYLCWLCLTFFTIPISTRSHANISTYWFLFSRQQLSNCKYSTSGNLLNWCTYDSNVYIRTFNVKLLSDGTSAVLIKMWELLPKGAVLWVSAPVMWVRNVHRLAVDLSFTVKWGNAVLAWSIPSIHMQRYLLFVLAFSLCLS